MAYFSNGSEGLVFDAQCLKCKYGQSPCPIASVQILYNYDASKDENLGCTTASKILDSLVSNDGKCAMFELAKQDFEIDPNQLEMF